MRDALQFFHRCTGLLILFSLMVMTLGPLVRAEDAGLACPDWPLCYGHVIPPYEYRVYLEFIHRVVAGLLGVIFVAWLALLVVTGSIRRKFWIPAVLALVLLAMQILLGGATITRKLAPYIVKSHLLNALLYVSCLLFIWKKSDSKRTAPSKNILAILLTGALALAIFIQIFLGGRVSTNEAGLACTDFPACYRVQSFSSDGSSSWQRIYLPPLRGLVEMHMTHRIVAYGVSILALTLLFFASTIGLTKRQQRFLLVIVAMIAVQILLGALNVLFQIPVPITVLHSLLANLIFLFCFENWLEGWVN